MISVETEIEEALDQANGIIKKNPNESYVLGKKALKMAREHGYGEEEGQALLVLAFACRSMTEMQESFQFAQEAVTIFKNIEHQSGLASAYNIIGIVYFYSAMYEKSLEYFLRGLHLLEKTDDEATISRVKNNLGEVYREAGYYEEALQAYEEALLICERHQLITNKAVILENMGEVFFTLNHLDSSYDYFYESYTLLLEREDQVPLAEVENKIGKVYFANGDYESALHFYKKALTRLKEVNNKFYSIDILVNLALYEKQTDQSNYLDYIYQAIGYAEDIQARKHLLRLYHILSNHYEEQNQFDLALDYYKKYHHVELEIESAIIAQKLEISKLELQQVQAGKDAEEMTKANQKLKDEIAVHKQMLDDLEKTNESLSGAVYQDELTRLANRRGIHEHLNTLWKEGQQDSKKIAFFMLDIDFFKRYNDFHGHIEGDRCLKQVAECLKNVFKPYKGLTGRFGGEEFVCLVEDLSFQDAEEIAEKARNEIEELPLCYKWEGEFYPVTISIGGTFGEVKQFNHMGQLYELADLELYRAKESGRNQVQLKGK
ncbi:tetratricopeptide repeat-containing diguanylate cyclase [Halalkalibacillus halophilus]|uniref:tetratricopeptide repeat-containing diguanylate cyclase n=1 Tax=Halalkalibacillus halophilus TaxID=392827 RepID=UPI0004056F82|nr:diguanylate cyclase [Halalkalibacillus halophilus]